MNIFQKGLVSASGILAVACGSGVVANSDDEVGYAGDLWQAMQSARLAGENPIESRPYVGTEPHGAVLQTLKTQLAVGDHTGQLVVKRNYGPAGVTPAEVWSNPDEHLAAITVMYRRESGYAADAGDWFWAKFKPDGSLDKNEAGAELAGKVDSCVACHRGAEDGDFLFANDPQG